MNRLILIGNGFDLAHGLKTSYHDFILDYFKGCLIKALTDETESRPIYDGKVLGYEDELLSIAVSVSYKLISIKINVVYVLEKSISNAQAISDIFSLINKDIIHVTFKGQGFTLAIFNECFEKKWVDIEALYYNELKKCLKQYNIDIDYSGNATLGNLDYLNQQLEFIKKKLKEYLNKIQSNSISCIIDSINHSIHLEKF